MNIKKLYEFPHKITHLTVFVFTILSLFLIFYRTPSDLKNMETLIIFQNDERLFFYDNHEKSIPEKAQFVVIKDLENVNFNEFIKKLGNRKLGILEFNISENLARKIAKFIPKNQIIYAHYIKPEELTNYTENKLFKRIWRAVVERSIDLIILPETKLTEIAREKASSFFNISSPHPYEQPLFPYKFFGIILGIYVLIFFPSAVFAFILFPLSYTIYVSTVSIIGTVVLFFRLQNNFEKFFAYFSLGILTNLSLYEFYFLNNIELYRGVKLSISLLPAIMLLKFILKRKQEIKGVLKIIIPFFAVAGIYYIIRSGNSDLVLNFERNFREFVENLFVIRPRTKELFLYPFLFGSQLISKDSIWFDMFELLGTIALVSTFNTFCHIRAPLFINGYREIITLLIALSIYGIIYFGRRVKT
ncbi:hypothetical protein JYK00_03965 [Thermosipho ferrireducens]|uniref:Uncharacterized protein n=1 Tax=Thermosipho ferrireducens TaxID=2571116 RepID=A0ABX7S7V6_9BACT|nr:DUF5693 family protein [Thermosipho ferrireducens]QTA38674.1 hypothetical protein JYK00_03965 [Thermosipho ferrireducens]